MCISPRVQYRVGNDGSQIGANDDWSGSSLAVVDLGTRWVRRRVFEITFSVWRDSYVTLQSVLKSFTVSTAEI